MSIRHLEHTYAVFETQSGQSTAMNLITRVSGVVAQGPLDFVSINVHGLLAAVYEMMLIVYDCNNAAHVMQYPLPERASLLSIGGHICVVKHKDNFSVVWLQGIHVGRAIDVPTTDVIAIAARANAPNVICGHTCGFVCEYEFAPNSSPLVKPLAFLALIINGVRNGDPVIAVADDGANGALVATNSEMTMWGAATTNAGEITCNLRGGPIAIASQMSGICVCNDTVWLQWPNGVAALGKPKAYKCNGARGVAQSCSHTVFCSTQGDAIWLH